MISRKRITAAVLLFGSVFVGIGAFAQGSRDAGEAGIESDAPGAQSRSGSDAARTEGPAAVYFTRRITPEAMTELYRVDGI